MYRWEKVSASDLYGLASKWDALAAKTHSRLVDEFYWVNAFAEAFEFSASLTFHTFYRQNDLVAVVPLFRQGGLFRTWCSAENEHWPYWSFPWESESNTNAMSKEILVRLLSDADSILFQPVHLRGPIVASFAAAARELAYPRSIAELNSGDSAIELKSSWEDFQNGLPSNLRRDLPRKLRQLERLGSLEMETLTDGGEKLHRALNECFDLETKGWKAVDGSPIKLNPQTLSF